LQADIVNIIANVGFPIAITCLLLRYIIPTMAKEGDILELRRSIVQLERNITVLTVVIAKSNKVNYDEAKRWVISNGHN
jgi:hypothetical protein